MARKTKRRFDATFGELVSELADAKRHLELLPDSQEWTQEALEELEDVRFASIRLAEEIDRTLEAFNGR